MNLIKAGKAQFSFQISAWERRAFFKLLKLYPLVPSGHQRLSRGGAKPEDQQLLEDSLNAQRAEHRRQVSKMMEAKSRFRRNKEGYRFVLKSGQMEWLLQVLNDIRIGSWVQLGSPDGPQRIIAALSDKTAAQFWAMEMAGHFQSVLLEALTEGEAADLRPSSND